MFTVMVALSLSLSLSVCVCVCVCLCDAGYRRGRLNLPPPAYTAEEAVRIQRGEVY